MQSNGLMCLHFSLFLWLSCCCGVCKWRFSQEAVSEDRLLQEYISFHPHSTEKNTWQNNWGDKWFIWFLVFFFPHSFRGDSFLWQGRHVRTHTAGGISGFWNQGGYNPQACLQPHASSDTSSTKTLSSKGSITSQNSAINWGSIDQTLVLVADNSYSTLDKYFIWIRQSFYKLLLVTMVGFDFEARCYYSAGWPWTDIVAQNRLTWKSWNFPASSFQVLEF